MAARTKQLEEQLDLFQRIFDNIYNGVMVTDAKGLITHFNRPYGKFLGLDPDSQIGKHCTQAIENSRMHIVAQTGKAEINHSQSIMGQNMVVQRIPIRKNGRVIAVFGQVMFKDIKDVRKLAQRLSILESKVQLYEEELISLRSTRYTFDSIIGHSQLMRRLKKKALRASTNQSPILLTGASGTGKELFAQAIHHASPRKIYPFVRINCAAIPKDLLESELFGYSKGAFTGARSKGKPGKFELAHRGTIFLDEIGDLPLEMQPKLLRVIEDKEFERIGGTAVVKSDFRLIAATNQNLEKMIAERRFRKDLFYRLNVIPLQIPPLKQRPQDIVPIANHLLARMAEDANWIKAELSPEAEQALVSHDWPGNVRELSNILERTMATIDGNTIHRQDLPIYVHDHVKPRIVPPSSPQTLKATLEAAEKEAIAQALAETQFNISHAARQLGIHRTLLYKKMAKHELTRAAG